MFSSKLLAVVCCFLLSSGQVLAQDASPNITTPSPTTKAQPVALPDAKAAPEQDKPPSKTKKVLAQAAVIAAIIAASVAFYKADSGGPCACPNDVDRAGRKCGKRSAHSRSGGYDVTCYPSDVTPEMISSWRAENEK